MPSLIVIRSLPIVLVITGKINILDKGVIVLIIGNNLISKRGLSEEPLNITNRFRLSDRGDKLLFKSI